MTINIVSSLRRVKVGSMVDRCKDDKNGLITNFKLQTVAITNDLTLKNGPKFKLQTVTITIDVTLSNEFAE